MQLTFSSSTGHPLVKNSNGSLRLGRWWKILPDNAHYISFRQVQSDYFSQAMVMGMHAAAKNADAWQAVNLNGFFYDVNLAVCFSEGYNPDGDWYDPWANAQATIALYPFTIPVEMRSRIVKKVFINLSRGGATLQEFSGEYIPLFPNPWYYDGLLGYKFFTSMPSSPYAMGATPHTTISADVLTSAGYGSSIIYDGGGFWTRFSGGQVNVSTPASVNSLCQGTTTVWLGAWFYSVTNFSIPYNYSRAEHHQNVRSGAPCLWIYA